MTVISKLQQYNYTKENINHIINYLTTKTIPPKLNARQRKAFVEKFGKDFTVEKNLLIYKPLNLIAVPSDDESIKNKVLQQVYKSPQALGKGQNNFHQLVLQKYLGIKRKDVIDFLKKQPSYQMYQVAPRNVNRALKATKPLQIVAIDLVDVENLYKKRDNKPYKFIFSAVDLHTGFTWYFPMKNKEATSTVEAFQKLLEYNLKFHSPETQRAMKSENKYDQIGTVISDNGLEFKGEFSQFLKAKNIKQKFRKSYSPQPQVEAVNGVLRNIMRAKFIQTGNLIWKPYIGDFMKAKNSNRDENTGQPAQKLMQEYFDKNQVELEKARDKLKAKRAKVDEKIKRFQKQSLQVGDKVRVKLANFQSAVRKELKAKNSKQIIVRFSPQIYTIEKVIPVKPDKVGFPLYVLKNSQNQIILNESGKKRIFGGNDLLKVPENTLPTNIDLTKANALNRIPKPNDGDTGRDLYIQPVEEGEVKMKEPKPKKEKKLKSPKLYSVKEWNDELQNKTFIDEGVKWKIYEVYKDKNRFVVDYFDSKFADRDEEFIKRLTKEFSYLKEVLQMSKNEEWFKPIYNEYLNPVRSN